MKTLATSTKLLYGLGFSARGIKDGLFQLFLFFYFSQVLGLDAALAGTASIIALLFDAVSDPLVGLWSDQFSSKKWGRRHPFMFASAIPLGLATWLLFSPPSGLEELGLFWWLTAFSILVRLALTFFIVPHMSLGAEMTTDYKERTSVTSYRIMFAAFVSPMIILLGLTIFFIPKEGQTHGLFNTDAYPIFAMLCGILMILFIVFSSWGTRHLIPNLPKASVEQKQMTVLQLISGMGIACRMKSFISLIAFVMTTYVGIGIGVVFTTYFATYFFEFSEKELALVPIGAAIGGILALALAPQLGEWMDKKWGAFVSAIISGLFFTLPFNLRLLNLFPGNESPSLLPVYILTLTIAYIFLWTAMSLANSMMADVVDAFELRTGNRQEGLFFATMSFAFKMTSGLGSFIAGLLLTWISFPRQAEVGEVSDEAIHGLGLVGGPILLTFYLSAVIFILFYPISKERYKEIRRQLDYTHKS